MTKAKPLDELAKHRQFKRAVNQDQILAWLVEHPKAVARIDEFLAAREGDAHTYSFPFLFEIIESEFGPLPFVQHSLFMFFAKGRWERSQERLKRG